MNGEVHHLWVPITGPLPLMIRSEFNKNSHTISFEQGADSCVWCLRIVFSVIANGDSVIFSHHLSPKRAEAKWHPLHTVDAILRQIKQEQRRLVLPWTNFGGRLRAIAIQCKTFHGNICLIFEIKQGDKLLRVRRKIIATKGYFSPVHNVSSCSFSKNPLGEV